MTVNSKKPYDYFEKHAIAAVIFLSPHNAHDISIFMHLDFHLKLYGRTVSEFKLSPMNASVKFVLGSILISGLLADQISLLIENSI